MDAATVLLVLVTAAAQAPKAAPADSAGATAAAPAAAEDPAAVVARAVQLQKEGRLAEAAEAYRRFLALVPKSWEARSNLGVVFAQLGQYEDAVREYRTALAEGPANSVVRHNLAVALYKAGRMREAAAELEVVLKAKPDHPTAPLLLADCRLQLGEWKQVIAQLDPLLEKDPENNAILYLIGTALMRDRQHERGQRVIDRILKQGDSAEAHLVLAIASHEASDDLAAEKELRRALVLNPSLPTANATLGEILVRMGDAPGAAEAFRRELSLNPNHADSHLLLGLLLRQEFDNEGAMAHLQKALTLRPGDPGVRYQIALVQLAKGSLNVARQTLEQLVREEPKFTEAHVSLASVYYRLRRKADGDREQAIVQQLNREKKEREDAERARQEAARP
jgi:tetratricopeptide (TPR) repeat protein